MSLAKATFNDIGTLSNPASARQALNDNFQKIEDEFKKVVYRDGSTPNSMEADLDMDSHRILNVADAVHDKDAVNKGQVADIAYEAAEVVWQPRFDDFVNHVEDELSRTLKLPPGYTNMSLPAPEPSRLIGWNAAGTGLRNNDLSGPGDLMLRSDLADPTGGAALVQYDDDETVKDRLDALADADDAVNQRIDELATGLGASLIGFKQAGTGSVERTVQDKLSEVFSVTDFGAVGDGVANDSPAIQAALDAGAGGTVVFPPNRTYKLFQPLQVPSNTTIVATGATFVCGPEIDNMLRNKADGVTGGYNANNNITIIGGKWFGDSGVDMSPFAFGHCSHVFISGVEIFNNNRYHHIEINSSAGVRVRDCIFRGGLDWCENVGTGYDVTLNEAIQIDNAGNSGQFPWFGPYDGTPCRDIEISGCRFLGVGTGIGTHSNPAAGLEPHTRINIHDNYFDGVFWAAIKTLSWSDVNISRNRIQSSYHGIVVAKSNVRQPNTINITHNSLYRLGYGNAPTSYGVSCGILVDGEAGGSYNARNVVVAGNVLHDGAGPTGGYGILVKHNKQAAVVSGNVVNSFNRDGIYINGAELCTVTGNTANLNNRASGSFSDFKLGGTTATSDSTRITCVGNTGGTMTVTYTQNTIVRNNNLYTSLTASDNAANTSIGDNIVGTTFS